MAASGPRNPARFRPAALLGLDPCHLVGSHFIKIYLGGAAPSAVFLIDTLELRPQAVVTPGEGHIRVKQGQIAICVNIAPQHNH